MSTKAEERTALKKIREIIDGLGGAESYIGMAFEGCFEIAEDNINNDFGRSMKQMLDSEQLRVRELLDAITGWKNEANELRSLLEKAKAENKDNIRQADEYKAWAEKRITDEEAEKVHYKECLAEMNEEVLEMRGRVQEAEMEVIELKARLYDLTVGKEAR